MGKYFTVEVLPDMGADGSTTAFSPVFDVQDKGDVKVKKNGAIQTLGGDDPDYTIADHATLDDKVTVTLFASTYSTSPCT